MLLFTSGFDHQSGATMVWSCMYTENKRLSYGWGFLLNLLFVRHFPFCFSAAVAPKIFSYRLPLIFLFLVFFPHFLFIVMKMFCGSIRANSGGGERERGQTPNGEGEEESGWSVSVNSKTRRGTQVMWQISLTRMANVVIPLLNNKVLMSSSALKHQSRDQSREK